MAFCEEFVGGGGSSIFHKHVATCADRIGMTIIRSGTDNLGEVIMSYMRQKVNECLSKTNAKSYIM
jgi:hypothetical protein